MHLRLTEVVLRYEATLGVKCMLDESICLRFHSHWSDYLYILKIPEV